MVGPLLLQIEVRYDGDTTTVRATQRRRNYGKGDTTATQLGHNWDNWDTTGTGLGHNYDSHNRS